jgi:hypothetical protein
MKKPKIHQIADSNPSKIDIEDLVSEVIRAVLDEQRFHKNTAFWTDKQKKKLNCNRKYNDLIEKYQEECNNSNCNHQSKQVMEAMYKEARRLFPEASVLDIISRIVSDTIRPHIGRIVNDMLVQDWELTGRSARIGGMPDCMDVDALDASKQNRQHSNDNGLKKRDSTCAQLEQNSRFQIVHCNLPEVRDNAEEFWSLCKGIPDDTYLLVNQNKEVIEMSSDRAELERIAWGLLS